MHMADVQSGDRHNSPHVGLVIPITCQGDLVPSTFILQHLKQALGGLKAVNVGVEFVGQIRLRGLQGHSNLPDREGSLGGF